MNVSLGHMARILDAINMIACYASEENTSAQAEALLLIGKLARQEIEPQDALGRSPTVGESHD